MLYFKKSVLNPVGVIVQFTAHPPTPGFSLIIPWLASTSRYPVEGGTLEAERLVVPEPSGSFFFIFTVS